MRLKTLLSVTVISFSAVLLSACGSSSSGNQNPDQNQPNEKIEMQDVTDRTQCNGPANGPVTARFTSQEAGSSAHVTSKMTVTFDLSNQGTITATNVCDMNGVISTASATAAADVTATQIIVQGTAQETRQNTVNGFTSKCSVNLQPMTLSYQLVGNCIALSTNGQTIYGIRQ